MHVIELYLEDLLPLKGKIAVNYQFVYDHVIDLKKKNNAESEIIALCLGRHDFF